jgi:hypothetical protein
LVAGVDQTILRRYTIIRKYSGLALEAATAAFILDRPDTALEWLEQGRCLVWSQQDQLRTPLDKLRTHSTTLAERVRDISRQLESAGSASRMQTMDMGPSQKISLEEEARNHLQLAGEWEDLLTTVRGITGFETFLQPVPSSALLQHIPTRGVVVVINVHSGRCDAVILRAGRNEPSHISLPNFSLEKAKHYRSVLSMQLQCHNLRARGAEVTFNSNSEAPERAAGPYRKQGMTGEDGVHSVLQGLWTEVVKPIFDFLGFLVSKISFKHKTDRLHCHRRQVRQESAYPGSGGVQQALCRFSLFMLLAFIGV